MELLRQTTQRLSAVYPAGEASALARMVMEDCFGLSLTDLMLDKDNELSSLQLQELQNITERLLQKEPIQYILGHTTFCGLSLLVAPGVLIPRPETQELVEWICNENMLENRSKKRVLDIGTGSGCIALTLAHRGFAVEAWDISPEALRIAQSNADRLGLEVSFAKQNILQQDTSAKDNEQFDIIVSNPPYICRKEAEEMDSNVLDHEPQLALFVPDNDPLLFYRHIASFATRSLRSGGELYFEINRAYAEDTCNLLKQNGFADVEMKEDQFCNPRMVRGVLPKPKNHV